MAIRCIFNYCNVYKLTISHPSKWRIFFLFGS